MRLAPRLLTTATLVNTLFFSLVTSASAQDTNPHLIPKPGETALGQLSPLPKSLTIESSPNPDDRFTSRDLTATLKDRGLSPKLGTGSGYRVLLTRLDSPTAKRLLSEHKLTFSDEMKPEGYILIAEPKQAVIIGATGAGIFYGAQTLKQLIRTDGPKPTIQTAVIRDWPAMRYRGIQDDLSRGPVPTLEYQKKQIRTFAAYKLNVYSPYFEQSLAYASNPLIAPPGGAMSRADVKELVAYAKQYHIDVIPEQEAFGHLHHVLKYDLYSGLAESPHGHVLAPDDPASLPLIKSWFSEIDSLFPSKFVHLGADETFELGLGRTKDRVTQQGLGPVYIGFLKQIEEALRPSGKRFLFWGDIAVSSPDLVKSLPHDMIAVAWNYWSFNGFEKSLRPFIDAGMETWVAPGVNGWSRVYPNNDVALRNIQGFIRDGQKLGSTGALNTTWDDDGEALFNSGWYGVLFGAAASWQPGESSIPDFESSFGLQFHGDGSGKIDDAQIKLSAAHALLAKAGLGDASDYLYWLDPYSTEGQLAAQKLRPFARDYRILAESAMVEIAQARASQKLREIDALEAMAQGARRMDFIGMKFELADEIVRLYAHASDTAAVGGNPTHDLTEISSNINARMMDLRDGYVLGRELYSRSWLAENRPYWLGNVLNRFDLAAQLWIKRADAVTQARAAWTRTKKLPPAEEVGIPKTMPGFTP